MDNQSIQLFQTTKNQETSGNLNYTIFAFAITAFLLTISAYFGYRLWKSSTYNNKTQRLTTKVVLPGWNVVTNEENIENLLISLGVFEDGVYIREKGMSEKYGVKEVHLTLDNGEYRWDKRWLDPNKRDVLLSSGDEGVSVGGVLDIKIGINTEYLKNLSRQEQQKFISRSITRTLVTFTEKHTTLEQVEEEVTRYLKELQGESLVIIKR